MSLTPITDLEIFVRVADAGNMSAAGREMGLSPAVVSKRISHMEERLGVRLFQRTTRQLKLTETGTGFYDRVVNILSDIADAEAFVSQLNDKVAGTLRVTAPAGFARMHVTPHLAAFMRQYPGLTIDMHLTDSIVDIVGEGIDVAIRIAELNDSSLVARKLAPSHRVICASPSYLEWHGVPRTYMDLSKHNCLAPSYYQTWHLKGPEGVVSVKTSGNLRTDSGDVIREAVLAGLGIGLCPTWSVADDLRNGRLQVLLPEYSDASGIAIHAVYPCRQFVPAKLRSFVDFLAQRFGTEPYWEKAFNTYAGTGISASQAVRVTPSFRASDSRSVL
ncbi:MAG: LysR family transcriptional regulator [Alphaproteobacteria bacterium]